MVAVSAAPPAPATRERILVVADDPERLDRLSDDLLGALDAATVLSTTDPAVARRWLGEAAVTGVVVAGDLAAAGAEELLAAAEARPDVRAVSVAGEADPAALASQLAASDREPDPEPLGAAELTAFLADVASALVGVADRAALERAVMVQALGSDLFADAWLVTYRPDVGGLVVGGAGTEPDEAVRPSGTIAAVADAVRWSLFTDEWTTVRTDGTTVLVLPVFVAGETPTGALLYVDGEPDGAGRERLDDLHAVLVRARAAIDAGADAERAEVVRAAGEGPTASGGDLAEIAYAEVVGYEVGLRVERARAAVAAARESGERYHLEKLDAALVRLEDVVATERRVLEGGPLVAERSLQSVNAVARTAWSNVGTGRANLQVLASARIRADHELLLRLFEHCVRNAVAHGAPGVTVRVRVAGDTLVVEDDGPGIPEADRERVFSWGYSSTGGAGYGLAIVERIARAHGWTVTATTGRLGGARFEFSGLQLADE